jgi:hypothetical protein
MAFIPDENDDKEDLSQVALNEAYHEKIRQQKAAIGLCCFMFGMYFGGAVVYLIFYLVLPEMRHHH